MQNIKINLNNIPKKKKHIKLYPVFLKRFPHWLGLGIFFIRIKSSDYPHIIPLEFFDERYFGIEFIFWFIGIAIVSYK